MKVHKSGNESFFPGGVVEWGDGSKEVYLEPHPSATKMLGDKPGEVVEPGGDESANYYINSRKQLCYG
jgi:hypothetical protein